MPDPLPADLVGTSPWVHEPPARTRLAAVLFHGGGVLLLGAALFVGFWAWVFAAFVTSTCGDVADPGKLRELRIAELAIGLAIAAVPGVWAAIARASRFRELVWIVVAGFLGTATVVLVLATTEVSHWCF